VPCRRPRVKEVPDCETAKVACVCRGSPFHRRDESNARKREAERNGERMRERARRTARVRKMEREGVRERKDSSGLLSSS